MLKKYILRTFWVGRALVLRSFWVGRALVLRSFWVGRALFYKTFFFVRSSRFHVYEFLFFLLESKLGKQLHLYQLLRGVRLVRSRVSSFLNKRRLQINGQSYCFNSIDKFAGTELIYSSVISESEQFSIALPVFLSNLESYPNLSVGPIMSRSISYRIYQNVSLIGRSEILIGVDELILPFGYNHLSDVLPVELDGELGFSKDGSRIKLLKRENSFYLEEAIHLMGSLTGNYAHWILEFLPKIVVLERLNIPQSVPILLDDWLHPRFIESVNYFLETERKFIQVSKYERLSVSKVHYIDNFSYTPPKDRQFLYMGKSPIPSKERHQFSLLGPKLLRERISNRSIDRKKSTKSKVFLLRTEKTSGNGRHIINLEELIKIANDYGYHVVDPADLTFQEQVYLFENAKVVVTPLGAAMANLVFAPEGCKVIGLSPRFQNGDYYYFAMLTSLLGQEFYYLLGDPTSGDPNNFNSNFRIQTELFKEVLDSFRSE